MNDTIRYIDDYSSLIELIGTLRGSAKLYAFFSKSVVDLYPELANQFEGAMKFVIEDEERSKSIAKATELWKVLCENGADRTSVLLAVGGGALTDLVGFVASTYMRGVACIYVPTTLLSMVDAAIGGKTAVNVGGVKNLVGTFCQPKGIYIYPAFLRTLPRRELISGYAEVIKHAILQGGDTFKRMLDTDLNCVFPDKEMIESNIQFKLGVVKADEQEQNGLRAQLNLGHTIGHAIEAYCNDEKSPLSPVLHGEAVMAGLICELFLSVIQRKGSTALVREIANYARPYFEPIPFSCDDYQFLLPYIEHDKKNKNGVINYVSVSAPGSFSIEPITDISVLRDAIDFYRETFV